MTLGAHCNISFPTCFTLRAQRQNLRFPRQLRLYAGQGSWSGSSREIPGVHPGELSRLPSSFSCCCSVSTRNRKLTLFFFFSLLLVSLFPCFPTAETKQSVPCGSSGVACSKSITLRLGSPNATKNEPDAEESIVLTAHKHISAGKYTERWGAFLQCSSIRPGLHLIYSLLASYFSYTVFSSSSAYGLQSRITCCKWNSSKKIYFYSFRF